MKTTKQKWENISLNVTPSSVARAYASFSLTGLPKAVADAELSAFETAGRVPEGLSAVEFDSADEYARYAQFRALYSKSSLKGDSKRKRDKAWEKFLAAEGACKRANRRLSYFGTHFSRENPFYREVLEVARIQISRCLGTFTENTLELILDLSRPGGGSAVGTLDARKVDWPSKFDGRRTDLCVSPAALPYARLLVEADERWVEAAAKGSDELEYKVTPFNRISFVPKDARSDRTIAVEPFLNGCLQLGAGNYIMRRLASFGVNLWDQTLNQGLAREGALNWEDADPVVTLDLASASDTLCQELVKRLLPKTWYEFLGDLRSEYYVVGRKLPVLYQKWSSMGNGYTFPLESLIFWALSVAVAHVQGQRPLVSIYGDDIIVTRGTAPSLIEVLRYVGFKVNTEKSYVFGPFRESCGADWWGGVRVTPVYLRGMQVLRETDVYRLINGTPGREPAMRQFLFSLLRGKRILFGPVTGDGENHVFFEGPLNRIPGATWSSRYQGYAYESAHYRPNKVSSGALPSYVAALAGSRRVTDGDAQPWSNLRRRGEWSTLKRIAS